MAKVKNSKKAGAPQWSYVANVHQLASGATRNKALLVGPAVFVSTRDVRHVGYSRMTPRIGVGPIKALLSKQAPRLFVASSDQVTRAATKATRFALAIDAYLQWGMRRKGKVLLIGGFEDSHETHLDVLAFENGSFVDYENKALPGRNAMHFPDAFAALLDDLAAKKPGFEIFQAAPLTPFDQAGPSMQYVDERIFRNLSFRPLSMHSTSAMREFAVPGAIVATAMLFCAGALGMGWSDYHGASTLFDKEIADPMVASQGGVDSRLIETIQQRRFYLEQPRRQVSLVEKSRNLVTGVAKIAGVRIVEIKLPAPSVSAGGASIGVPVQGEGANTGADRKPDVWLRVAVQLEPNVSVLEQGKQLMTLISANTGMDVRLAHQGWTDDGKRRVFTLEGFIHV